MILKIKSIKTFIKLRLRGDWGRERGILLILSPHTLGDLLKIKSIKNAQKIARVMIGVRTNLLRVDL